MYEAPANAGAFLMGIYGAGRGVADANCIVAVANPGVVAAKSRLADANPTTSL